MEETTNSSMSAADSAISISYGQSPLSSTVFSDISSSSTSFLNPLTAKKRERRQSSKTSNSSTTTTTKPQLARIKTSVSIDSRRSSNLQTKRPRKIKKERKQYVCNVCNKQFLGTSDLRKHLLIHSNEKPFECDQCHNKFRQAISLKNHIASIHGTSIKFTCHHCSRTFPIKERLRLHMRIHSGEKPYKCSKCTKSFARGGQLRQHLITHQNQFNSKKIVCDKCSQSFSSLAALRNHITSHENELEFPCRICNKKFYEENALRHHLASSHANIKTFHCEICNKTLKGHIAEHMNTHENIRPYVCEVCLAPFAQKSQLNVHLRMHSGERPYRCEVCWQAFAYSSVLKLHIRKHTGEKPFKCLQSECKSNSIAFSQLAHLKTHMKTIHKLEKAYQCEGCKEFFKIKLELQTHQETCQSYQNHNDSNCSNVQVEEQESSNLSKLRLLVAILLKKISTPERLKQLGYEKRLIDNVIITALKLADRKYFEDPEINDLDRLKLNVEQFLEWTIPVTFMSTFKEKELTIEAILEEFCFK